MHMRRVRGDAAPQEQARIPAIPVISPSEQASGQPFPLLTEVSPIVGWHFQPPAKGGPVFVIMRFGVIGFFKVVESFPLTEDGWARAWQSLVRQNPAAVPQVLARLEAREAAAAGEHAKLIPAVSELDARTLVTLGEVAYLGGYVPVGDHAGRAIRRAVP